MKLEGGNVNTSNLRHFNALRADLRDALARSGWHSLLAELAGIAERCGQTAVADGLALLATETAPPPLGKGDPRSPAEVAAAWAALGAKQTGAEA